jgi:hypothetical protein
MVTPSRSLDWKTALGLLALAAFLLLASPGVRVARAEPAPSEGASCEAGAPAAGESPELAHLLERLRREAELGPAPARRGSDPEAFVPLNGRGYNYGAAAGPGAAEPVGEVGGR